MKESKKLKKILIVISSILALLSLNFLGIINSVNASELVTNTKLQKTGDCGKLLKYKGEEIVTTYVAYEEDGKLYPAYCLNANLPGINEKGSYEVSTKNLVSDVKLWRRVINGYPYKTVEELGCKNKEEAFTATKHAIYCYIHGYDPNDYKGIGEAGKRTLKAMKKIISNSEKSKETKIEPKINIKNDKLGWKVDRLDSQYVSKTYKVKANADYKNYTINIEKNGDTELPAGLKITDENNNEKNVLNKDEKFKVLIPIKNLTNNGEFKLKVKCEMNTKPVLYGKAPNSNLQDYAITTLKYEDGEGVLSDSYKENITQITITKQEKNTEKVLEGVSFDVLDNQKDVIYSGLKTDKDGKITLKGINPGKYYVRETNALDGYVKYDEDIEANVELNEDFKLTVNNSKEEKIEVEKLEKQVVVGKELKQSEIKEKIETAQIDKKGENKKENKEKKTTQKNENNQNIEKNIKEVEEKQNSNIKRLPVTGM